jgi:hypothetical protein
MSVVKLRYACSVFVVSAMLAACAPRAAVPPASPSPPAASAAALAAKPVEWSKRGSAPLAWPAQVRHVQVIITHGWDKDERFVWLIANGTDVVLVFDTTTESVADVVDAAAHAYRAVVSNPVDSLSYGVTGSTYAPPPPRPQLTLPTVFVEHVLAMAWRINLATERAEAAAHE